MGPAAAARGPGWASKGGRGQESGQAKGAGGILKIRRLSMDREPRRNLGHLNVLELKDLLIFW